jgi:hypothetical protein
MGLEVGQMNSNVRRGQGIEKIGNGTSKNGGLDKKVNRQQQKSNAHEFYGCHVYSHIQGEWFSYLYFSQLMGTRVGYQRPHLW